MDNYFEGETCILRTVCNAKEMLIALIGTEIYNLKIEL